MLHVAWYRLKTFGSVETRTLVPVVLFHGFNVRHGQALVNHHLSRIHRVALRRQGACERPSEIPGENHFSNSVSGDMVAAVEIPANGDNQNDAAVAIEAARAPA